MSSFSIAAPRCEYRDNPLGIDVPRPRLSWQMRTPRRGARQRAYRVRAASSESDLLNSTQLLWDSGRVESDQSIHVPYAGPPLASGQRVYWQVSVWDEAGAQADSAPAWWEMGLLERADWRAWRAQWIGAAWVGGPFTTSPAVYLRKAFSIAV